MRNEKKWTPGPWVRDPLDLGVVGDISTNGGICVAQAQQIDGRLKGFTDLEREANANLIAAAPELYDVLIECQIKGGLGVGLHRKIDRVLAKARGES